MALAFPETPRTQAAELTWRQETETRPDAEIGTHVDTYRKFSRFVLIAFCCVPLIVAFVLYWTT